MRLLRWIAVLAALVSAAAVVATADMKPAALDEPYAVEVRAEPIAGFWKDGKPFENPRLQWRGGLVLTSTSPHFGGWSGLMMDGEGKSFVALSDTGVWMTGDIVYDGARPSGMAAARVGPVRGEDGKPLSAAKDRDAESITLATGNLQAGTAYIGFERNSRIASVGIERNGLSAIKSLLHIPEEAKDIGNDGFEALFTLQHGPHAGALVAVLESPLPGETRHRGWIWIDGKPAAFNVDGIGDYGITDAASLPDGSVLLLERRFRITDGVRIRLRRIGAGEIAPGAIAKGEVLLEADGVTAEIDNLEAIAISHDAHGKIVITIMSDDNFNHAMQRNLLLQFTLQNPVMTSP